MRNFDSYRHKLLYEHTAEDISQKTHSQHQILKRSDMDLVWAKVPELLRFYGLFACTAVSNTVTNVKYQMLVTCVEVPTTGAFWPFWITGTHSCVIMVGLNLSGLHELWEGQWSGFLASHWANGFGRKLRCSPTQEKAAQSREWTDSIHSPCSFCSKGFVKTRVVLPDRHSERKQ